MSQTSGAFITEGQCTQEGRAGRSGEEQLPQEQTGLGIYSETRVQNIQDLGVAL